MRRVHWLALAVAAGGLIDTLPVNAAAPAADIAADSELILSEHVEWGAYRDYSVSIRLHKKKATLVAVKDGHRTAVKLPYSQTMELWTSLQRSEMETLPNAQAGLEYPDQADFNVEYRVKGESGGFKAYAVDFLEDARYRDIVREIQNLADSHVKLAAKKKKNKKGR